MLIIHAISLCAMEDKEEQAYIQNCKDVNRLRPITALEDSNKTLCWVIENFDPDATPLGYATLERLQAKQSLTKQELLERYQRKYDVGKSEYNKLEQS